MEMKCDCCMENSEMGAVSKDNKVICDECLKYAPNYYGSMSGKELIKYIKQKKSKKWWQI